MQIIVNNYTFRERKLLCINMVYSLINKELKINFLIYSCLLLCLKKINNAKVQDFFKSQNAENLHNYSNKQIPITVYC